jgi:hypothetical protein
MSISSKRILNVTVKQIPDIDPDTSYLGTYSDTPENEFSIERKNVGTREYHWFNPATVEPYDATASWIPAHVKNRRTYWLRAMRKNARQDFERMESLNRGQWEYIGVVADAEIVVDHTVQNIKSGGLWGVESDSGDYLKEIANEQLSELREQLHALGFGKRAISKAMAGVRQ